MKFKIVHWVFIGSVIFIVLLILLNNVEDSPEDEQIDYSPNQTNLTDSQSSIYNEDSNSIKDEFSKSDEVHWSHIPLTYKINKDACGVSQPTKNTGKTETQLVEWAFLIIQNETNYSVTFEETEGIPDIFINCTSDYKHESYGGTLAETLTYYWTGTNLYAEAEIQFYMINPNAFTYGACTNYPTVEIHEILHLLGLEHEGVMGNLMSEMASWCPPTRETYIDKSIIDYLQRIYYKD